MTLFKYLIINVGIQTTDFILLVEIQPSFKYFVCHIEQIRTLRGWCQSVYYSFFFEVLFQIRV